MAEARVTQPIVCPHKLGDLPCTSNVPLGTPLHMGDGRGCTHRASNGSWKSEHDKPGDGG